MYVVRDVQPCQEERALFGFFDGTTVYEGGHGHPYPVQCAERVVSVTMSTSIIPS